MLLSDVQSILDRPSSRRSSALVATNLRFDARLALFHESERWLAIADLHYGFELSQKAAGGLFPSWGRSQIEERVAGLLADYRPSTLVLLGDLVHTSASVPCFVDWLQTLEKLVPQIIFLRGNHDRKLKKLPLLDIWRSGRHLFYHGDREIVAEPEDIIYCGHHHPAIHLNDGAGFRKKIPALCKLKNGWILPAFSPWAAGGKPRNVDILEVWVANQLQIWKIKHQ